MRYCLMEDAFLPRRSFFLLRGVFLLLLILLVHLVGFGQPGDCETATRLELNLKDRTIQIDSPAVGFGMKQEISAPRGDPYFFRQEHHSHWYLFQTPFSGHLGLEIRPKKIEDDYDFLLFIDSTGSACEQIMAKNIRPLRSVISRNDTRIKSFTGLSAFSKATHQEEGPGLSYTQAITVKKGQEFILVVDNVYGGGEGYELEFFFYFRPRLFGKVIDGSDQHPLVSKIYIEEVEERKRVDSLFSDSTGRYQARQPLEFQKTYKLIFEAEGYFSDSREISFPYLKQHRGEPINIALTRMEPGATITLNNIHFKGNLAEFVPATYPHLEELLEFMERYPSLVVQLEGHVNGVGFNNCEGNEMLLNLSLNRAKAVKRYLVEHGIAAERMGIEGFGCSRMLYPEAYSEALMAKNRRVELKVVSF